MTDGRILEGCHFFFSVVERGVCGLRGRKKRGKSGIVGNRVGRVLFRVLFEI